MRRLYLSLFLFSLILGFALPFPARAQQALATVNLYNADATTFPTVTAFVDVFDAQKIFVSGLKPEAVTAVENGQALPVDSLLEMAVPLQLVVAVNQGEALDARDANNISRFQRVSQIISQWAQSRPSDLLDDLSLVSQAGPVINHATPADFIVGLDGFQPDMRTAAPNLQSLSTALDVVSAQTTRLGMKRAVLFITPQMTDPNLAATLEPLIQRAIDENVRVFVWYVDANTTFTTTSAAIFNNLAIQTGGSMFQYSGAERFPDPEIYFSGLRRVYQLSYTSRLTTSGDHSLTAQVNLPGQGTLNSVEQKFTLDIQPPNPFPVAPVSQITRQAPEEDPFNTELLLPETQEIDIIVEFPDGHQRPLTRTSLYVDGAVVDENTAEPFDKFTWDLTGYSSTGEHQVAVEAVDVLGLSKTSMAIPVTVTVVKPPSGPAAFLAKYRTPITIGSIILAGLVLFIILLSGRVRLPTLRTVREARRAQTDPLTQPVSVLAEEPAIPVPEAKKKSPKRRTPSKKKETAPKSVAEAPASLIRLNPDGQYAAAAPIPLSEKEIVFGADPVQCSAILNDPSVAPVHARLRMTDDGGYLLLDNHSIGGTWVNYEPIPQEGYRLMHGDMVNFGQLIFRFMLTTPPPAFQPKVLVQNIEE